ncbi:MAG: transposase domain-containing protein, partial [Gammaproteobacteria bacterium]|nr:transposase domain-containing protein [Gammaproteobacteria bacterium]
GGFGQFREHVSQISIRFQANGLEPYAYLRYLLTQLPATESVEDFEALLPGNIGKKQIPFCQYQ